MSITRRLFLLNTAAAGAVGATLSASAATDAAALRTPSEEAVWHIRELERLLVNGGGDRPVVIVQADYGQDDIRGCGISYFGTLKVDETMFDRAAS